MDRKFIVIKVIKINIINIDQKPKEGPVIYWVKFVGRIVCGLSMIERIIILLI